MTTPPGRSPLRIRLDRAITLRALAIGGVVLFHAVTLPFGAAGAKIELAAAEAGSVAKTVLHAVWSGLPTFDQLVTIFFLMAGYFAQRAYQRSRLAHTNRSRRRFLKFFLWRRFWRLVPAFWVALLFSYFVSFDHPFTWDGLRKLAVNASLFKTLYPGYIFSINHAHWYVAVQWQLDLLYPVFLFILARRSRRFAVIVAWLASMVFLFVVPQFTDVAYLRYFPVRWWAEWSLGVYLADRHWAGVRVFSRPQWVLIAAAVAVVVGRIEGLRVLEWLALRVFLAAAFEALLLSRSPRLAVERWIAPLGVCSYSLYLLHLPIQQLVLRAFRAIGADLRSVAVWLAFAAVSFAVSFWLAKLSAEHIELKSSALGNRLWRRRFRIRAWIRRRRTRAFAPVLALEPAVEPDAEAPLSAALAVPKNDPAVEK